MRPRPGEALLEETDLVAVSLGAVVVLVRLSHDDHHGSVDVPAEGGGVGYGVDGRTGPT